MANCGNCLYQGDRSADQQGNTTVFCLVKAIWLGEEKRCDHFRDYADIGKEVRSSMAADLRMQDSEDRRLKKIASFQLRTVIITMVTSFVLFWATVKLFDKYIF